MAIADFLIEALLPGKPANGGGCGKTSLRWYEGGANTDTIKAQRSYSDYRRVYPHIPFRVVERATRRIVVLFDPRQDAA